ncbi:electron transfer flavoprotein subunit alpha/FixB family protein [Sinorhizobium chiapasense]|uniref:Electron transfer flavoprotein subunit alpha/FixB family protein n=1 Tax=Sinorhizobium chiapasense TaxID=501572 RepID=A0ABZ2BI62_9HYPH
MTTLLIAEHDNAQLNETSRRALSAASALGAPVHILVAGLQAQAAAEAAAKLRGVDKVLFADDNIYEHQLAEPLTELVLSISSSYEAFVAPATSNGKSLMPRIAARLDVMQVSDIISVISQDTFERPIYAGNAIQMVQATDAKKVITVRTAAFPPVPMGGAANIEMISASTDPQLSRFVQEEIAQSSRPDLTSARVIVSGGRSLGSAENFNRLIEPVADQLVAAIGASRAAVDAGYAPNDWQVGQTGKVVAPDLYIAVGISGAIQHLAGMKDSKVIVAINKDPDAPIFQVADYGLVGDLFEVLPQLQQELAIA